MISAGDFKNGITLEIDGNVCQIVEFQHVLNVLICSISMMMVIYTTS